LKDQNVSCQVKLTGLSSRLLFARKLMVNYHQAARTLKVFCGDVEFQEDGWFSFGVESLARFHIRVEYRGDALSRPLRTPEPWLDPGLPRTYRGKTQRVVHSGEYSTSHALYERAHLRVDDSSTKGWLRRLETASNLSKMKSGR
jgi:hypothetical protein